MSRVSRDDMLVELASDEVTEAQELALHDYATFHALLQPLFLESLTNRFIDRTDEELAEFYQMRLGVWPEGFEREEEDDQ